MKPTTNTRKLRTTEDATRSTAARRRTLDLRAARRAKGQAR